MTFIVNTPADAGGDATQREGERVKIQEMDRILREEMQHISSDKAKWWHWVFRMSYYMIRRHDLAQNPVTKRRDPFLKCVEDVRRTNPDFNPIDLDYNTSFFGPVPLDSTKPLEPVEREKLLVSHY